MNGYICHYSSPLGRILLKEDEESLSGLWFEMTKGCPLSLGQHSAKETPLLISVKRWLDSYFEGENPSFMPPLYIEGTEFQKKVWSLLLEIPYGKVVTYGEIARRIANEKGIKKMSAQAVGQAVGKNKISLIIPCHRVMGEKGKLTGYGGEVWRKERLLKLEGII